MARHVEDFVGGVGQFIRPTDGDDPVVFDIEAAVAQLATLSVHRDQHVRMPHQHRPAALAGGSRHAG